MKPLPNAAQMRAAERYTIDVLRIPAFVLMERAAAALVQSLYKWKLDLRRVCIVCGSGNNGGDGFAIGRLLLQDQYPVEVVFAGKKEHQTPDCKRQMDWYVKLGGQILEDWNPDEYSVIIDAVFGIGLSHEVEGEYLELIHKMNRARTTRVAVDLPSGLSASTGEILGSAVLADYTVTFQFLKVGMALYPGKEVCGTVDIVDIGISANTLLEAEDVVFSLEPAQYREKMPVREADSHKGIYGKVAVIAGSKGMSGAAYFNARSAYLTGAGLVRIYTPEENRVILQQQLPEAMVSSYTSFDEAQLKELLDWSDVVCIGSGIGQDETAVKIVETVLSYYKKQGVIDADALNILGKHPEFFPESGLERYVLTPHMMEMSRLCRKPIEKVKKDRILTLERWIQSHKSVCVLKGSKTVIAGPAKGMVLNESGNCAMAKGGSGDVLTGMIAGLLAQGVSCMDSAALGCYLHGRAGDFAKNWIGEYSVLASDLMKHISSAIMEIQDVT